jgi:hypothetical protein
MSFSVCFCGKFEASCLLIIKILANLVLIKLQFVLKAHLIIHNFPFDY